MIDRIHLLVLFFLFKKIQLRANPPEADRNWLNTQLQLKKSILTTKPTYVDWLGIGAA
jgi:hypothetical protein